MTLRWDARNRVGSAVSDWTARQFLVEYLVVAGGDGGGSTDGGGGGGAGGMRVGALPVTAGTSYTITVGAGGAGGAAGFYGGSNGSDSVFSTVTSTGGGGGATYGGGSSGPLTNGASGGSGVGCAWFDFAELEGC